MESDSAEVAPATVIRGTVRVPGDKSISHRLAMLGGIADGTTLIHNFAESADCQSTLECLKQLGVTIRLDGSTVTIQGRGLHGLQPPTRDLDAGNSGTTVRLMSGILSGQSFESTFVGDASLSRRPMRRIMDPLRQFGATLTAKDDNFLPLRIRGTQLTAIDYTLPVACTGEIRRSACRSFCRRHHSSPRADAQPQSHRTGLEGIWSDRAHQPWNDRDRWRHSLNGRNVHCLRRYFFCCLSHCGGCHTAGIASSAGGRGNGMKAGPVFSIHPSGDGSSHSSRTEGAHRRRTHSRHSR